MEPIKEPRYKYIFDKSLEVTSDYKVATRILNEEGSITIHEGRGRVYSVELFLFFYNPETPVTNLETKLPEIIKGKDFVSSFLDGFKLGRDEFKNQVDDVYSREERINVLKELYFTREEDDEIIQGWDMVVNRYPVVITQRNIHEWGFYSGLVSKIEDYENKTRISIRKFSHKKNSLSHREEAIKVMYLMKANKIVELGFQPRKYAKENNRNATQFYKQGWNTVYSDTGANYKTPTIEELKNVRNSLSDYPNIQRAIDNDIYKLSTSQ